METQRKKCLNLLKENENRFRYLRIIVSHDVMCFAQIDLVIKPFDFNGAFGANVR